MGTSLIDMESVEFGCRSCNYDDAWDACDELVGYHICSIQELARNGWLTGRKRGFIRSDADVWVNPDTMISPEYQAETEDTSIQKIGICCNGK